MSKLRKDPHLQAVLTSFRFGVEGSPAAPPPDAPHPKGYRQALQSWLYRSVFIRPPAAAAAAEPLLPRPDEATYIRQLDAANSSRELWEGGFVVTQVHRRGAVTANREELSFRLRTGQYHPTFAESLAPRVGTSVMVRRPRASLTLQRGVYYAFGEALQKNDDQALSRFYLAGDGGEGTPALFAFLVSALNRNQIPFTLKTLLASAERHRTDATVLYLPRSFEKNVLTLLDARPKSTTLGPRAPLFTHEVQPGIGLADEPGGGESFGQSRCRLLADALLDAYLRSDESVEGRFAALEERYRQAGLDPQQPHRGRLHPPSSSAAAKDRGQKQAGVISHLVKRGLIPAAQAPRWRLRQQRRRNDNYVAQPPAADAPGVFVKALRVPGEESRAMALRERAIYRFAAGEARLATLTPRYLGHEDEPLALFLEAPAGAAGARQAYPDGALPEVIARAAGDQLARLHQLDPLQRDELSPHWRHQAPGILTAHRGGPLTRWLSSIQRALVDRWSQETALVEALDELAHEAGTRRHFTHGDMKLDNLLLLPSAPNVLLIDWELADLGDPAWDAGSLLASCLEPWILHGSAAPCSLGERVSHATPISSAPRSIAEAWSASYAPHAQPQRLLRATRYAGARLLQSALEHSHRLRTPHRHAPAFLASARSLLLEPEISARHLHWLP